jgi:CBS domain containing-hemolysin-like protein
VNVSDPLYRSRDQSRGERPSLFDRLRSFFVREETSVREDIEGALDDESLASDISAQERAMLRNVLNLHELRVSDVMVPRGEIVAVSLEDTIARVAEVFRTAGHSRLPVYAETLDDPRGMIHIRDFFNYLSGRNAAQPAGSLAADDLLETVSQTDIIRPVLFVPPSMPALELLVKMQAARTHMALVIDEYGGTDGLASIEDIVELIVGEIEDEHDPVEGPLFALTDEGAWVVDARADLEEVDEGAGFRLSETPDAESVETIGGLVTLIAGRVPAKGERIRYAGAVEFEILDADPRRVKKVLMRRVENDQSGAPEAGESHGSQIQS